MRASIHTTQLLCFSILMMTTAQAENIDKTHPDADFLEFLAEVDEATGVGFDSWLETDTAADTDTTDE